MQKVLEADLAISLDTNPSGEDIERFCTSIVEHVKPKGPHSVPSFTWLQKALSPMTKKLVHHYKYFHLSRNEISRIASNLKRLARIGKLTREPQFQKNWVGTAIIRRLAKYSLEHALQEGTINWDVTLAKVLSMVLVSALACRVEDINQHALDPQEIPFLCYRDVTMKLDGGASLDDLKASLVIRGEKDQKYTPLPLSPKGRS